MSKLWTTNRFTTGGSPSTTFYGYDNDSGIWSTFTGWPNIAVVGTDNTKRTQGGWDGTYWYAISTDGKLYRMDGTTRAWSAALLGGTQVVSTAGGISAHSWCMCSDGRFIYILIDTTDFRRYDPVNDTITTLAPPVNGGTVSGSRAYLAFDGVDTIYANKAAGGNHQKYTISSGLWSNLTTFTQSGGDLIAMGVCLQGKLWVFSHDFGVSNNMLVTVYDPNTTVWTAKASQNMSALTGCTPYGEDTDFTIRFWMDGTTSYIYNVGTNSWSTGSPPPVNLSTDNGTNFVVTRLFSPASSYFQSDGVTALAPAYLQGSAVIGQTIVTQIKVQTPVSRGGGATVSVVNNVQTDAEDVVTVCATAGGSYTSSFVTGALSAGQFFDVFIKVTPSSVQTTGLTKNWNLRVI